MLKSRCPNPHGRICMVNLDEPNGVIVSLKIWKECCGSFRGENRMIVLELWLPRSIHAIRMVIGGQKSSLKTLKRALIEPVLVAP